MDQASHPPARSDALHRLSFLGWRRSIAAIVVGLAVSFLLLGYFVVYWRNADMDFMVVYSALAINAGKPQQYLDHPAYLTILSVKSWFALLHQLGLLDAWTLPAIPKARRRRYRPSPVGRATVLRGLGGAPYRGDMEQLEGQPHGLTVYLRPVPDVS